MANKRDKRKRMRPTTRAGRAAQALENKRFDPSAHILARRSLFSFVRPVEKEGPDGRFGEIDSEICDGIGQLHACGLLDGHGIEAIDLRNAGRRYGGLYWIRNGDKAPSGQRLERGDRATQSYAVTHADLDFDKCSNALTRMAYEHGVLELVVCDYWFKDHLAPFVFRLVTTELLKRGKRPPLVELSGAHDLDLLAALIRALAAIHDALLPGRFERRAA